MGLIETVQQKAFATLLRNLLPDTMVVEPDGTILFADDLTPEHIRDFVGLLHHTQYETGDDAVAELLTQAGVKRKTVQFIKGVVKEGKVDIAAAVSMSLHGKLTTELFDFGHLMELVHAHVVEVVVAIEPLQLSADDCTSLDRTVELTRNRVAEILGCQSSWDAIHPRLLELNKLLESIETPDASASSG